MTMSGGTWTPTKTTPAPGAGALTPASAAQDIMTWLSDNARGDISALDMRNSFDLVLSLLGDALSVFDPTKAYTKGAVVLVANTTTTPTSYTVWRATAAIPASTAVPGATGASASWSPVGSSGDLLIVATDADRPATPSDGQHVFNLARRTIDVWEKSTSRWYSAGQSKITLNAVHGHTPTTDPPSGPQLGDIFINTVDRSGFVYVADIPGAPHAAPGPGGVVAPVPGWVQASGGAPVVTLSASTGQSPATNPPIDPNVGDWWINEIDNTMWLYAIGGGAAVSPATGWQPMTPQSGNVFISDAAGTVPSNPNLAGGEKLFTFPPGTRLEEGDRFVNRVDHTNYVYAPDPAAGTGSVKVGAMIWVKLPADNAATLSVTPGEVPTSPAPAGGSAHLFTRPPKVGDIFVNRADGKTWVRVTDTGPGATGDIWELVPTTQMTVSTVAGESPMALGTAVLPTVTYVGDHFINRTDGLTWIAVQGAAGIEWQVVSVPVLFRNMRELGPNYAPLATEIGLPGQYMVTPQSVWVWATTPEREALDARGTGNIPSGGVYLGEGVNPPNARTDGSALQRGDLWINRGTAMPFGQNDIFYYSGSWSDSGTAIDDYATLTGGGKWWKDFDIQMPVWTPTKQFARGDTILLPPVTIGSPWTIWRVDQSVIGPTTAGQRPDAAGNTEFVAVGGSGGGGVQAAGRSLGLAPGVDPNGVAKFATGNGAEVGDLLITPDAVYRWAPSAADWIASYLGLDLNTMDSSDPATMAALGLRPTIDRMKPIDNGEYNDAASIPQPFVNSANGGPMGYGDWWFIQTNPTDTMNWIIVISSDNPQTATPNDGPAFVPLFDTNNQIVEFPRNAWSAVGGGSPATGWIKVVDFASGGSNKIAPNFSQNTVAGQTPDTRMGVLPAIGPDPTFDGSAPSDTDPATSWPFDNTEPAGVSIGDSRTTEHGVEVWDGGAWKPGFDFIGWARPYDTWHDTADAPYTAPDSAAWPDNHRLAERIRIGGDVWEWRDPSDPTTNGGLPYDFVIPLTNGVKYDMTDFATSDFAVPDSRPGGNYDFSIEVPAGYSPGPNVPVEPTVTSITTASMPTDGLLAYIEQKDIAAPAMTGWHTAGAIYLDAAGNVGLYFSHIPDATTDAPTLSGAPVPTDQAGAISTMTNQPLALGQKHDLHLGFFSINVPGVMVANGGLPYFSIRDTGPGGGTPQSIAGVPAAPPAGTPSNYFMRLRWVSRQVQLNAITEAGAATPLTSEAIVAAANTANPVGLVAVGDTETVTFGGTGDFTVSRRVAAANAGSWARIDTVADAVRWWTKASGAAAGGAGVTVSNVAGVAPTAAAPVNPKKGDEFVNTTDQRNWVYDGTTWVERAAAPSGRVTTSVVAGETPITHPPTGTPNEGDEYVNVTDNKNWVFDSLAWVERKAASSEEVYVYHQPGLTPGSGFWSWRPQYDVPHAVHNESDDYLTPARTPELTAWRAQAQGTDPLFFINVTTQGSGTTAEHLMDVMVDETICPGPLPHGANAHWATGIPTPAQVRAVRMDRTDYPSTDFYPNGTTNPDGSLKAHLPIHPVLMSDQDRFPVDTIVVWLDSVTGDFQVGKEDAAGVRTVFDAAPMSDGFAAGKHTFWPATTDKTALLQQAPITGVKGDEFVNTADDRSWVHDGKGWVERTHDRLLRETVRLQGSVTAFQSSPPASPILGMRYIVKPTGLAAWGGRNNEIVTWDGNNWIFTPLSAGQIVVDNSTGNRMRWDGPTTGWTVIGSKYSELIDVEQTTPADGDIAIYNTTSGLWEFSNPIRGLVSGIEHEASVLDYTTTPPAAPGDGDQYIVKAPADAGVWHGHGNEIARFDQGAWTFSPARANETHLVEATQETFHFNGGAWVKVAAAVTAPFRDTTVGAFQHKFANPPFEMTRVNAWSQLFAKGPAGADLHCGFDKERADTLLRIDGRFSVYTGANGIVEISMRVQDSAMGWHHSTLLTNQWTNASDWHYPIPLQGFIPVAPAGPLVASLWMKSPQGTYISFDENDSFHYTITEVAPTRGLTALGPVT